MSELQEQVRPGHTLFVVDDAGAETRVRLTALTSSTLTLHADGSARTYDAAQIRQVQRYGDSLRNGAIIGAAIVGPYVLVGSLLASGDPACSDGGCIGAGTAVIAVGGAALLGAGIDALLRSRHLVFVRPTSARGDRTWRIVPWVERGAGVATGAIAGRPATDPTARSRSRHQPDA